MEMIKITNCLLLVASLLLKLHSSNASSSSLDYADALEKSILFFEGQRSGKLPADQRMTWRGDSALSDGSANHVDLVGGYYDAGDNVKFGFPMAFTTTMLAWSVIEFGDKMQGQLDHARAAVRWGADYLLKAATATPNTLYVQVADPNKDHQCWERPEDMDTPRGVYKVFDFADRYRGAYSDSLSSVVSPFYTSYSGYQDELLWGAAWLHWASDDISYMSYIQSNGNTLGHKTMTTPSAGTISASVDYILGQNPAKMSYMVGYGARYPLHVHHRGSSLPSVHANPSHISCNDGFRYLNSGSPNPNVLVGPC
uniref:Endoglucanase n=1 Tax=Ananas comosus var. bracteatus TaxID=296719 RepID=A0A6V7QBZ5_ANACO|nr:unnamed protein product [Ananas comosus var. bracteatus]